MKRLVGGLFESICTLFAKSIIFSFLCLNQMFLVFAIKKWKSEKDLRDQAINAPSNLLLLLLANFVPKAKL